MEKPVNTILEDIERDHGCTVRFAVQAGSRAHGVAAPESDSDIRFVYAHPVDWYLRLEAGEDTIERYFPGDVDCTGWDVRKALRLFAGCNPPLCEWLASPTVYRAEGGLLAAMQEQAPHYFNPQKAMHYYLGTARNIYDNFLDGDSIPVWKLFQVVRPLAATAWIAERHTMPPVPLADLLEAELLPDAPAADVAHMLASRQDAPAGERVYVPAELHRWIANAFARYHEQAHTMAPGTTPGWAPLNALFRQAIGAPNLEA